MAKKTKNPKSVSEQSKVLDDWEAGIEKVLRRLDELLALTGVGQKDATDPQQPCESMRGEAVAHSSPPEGAGQPASPPDDRPRLITGIDATGSMCGLDKGGFGVRVAIDGRESQNARVIGRVNGRRVVLNVKVDDAWCSAAKHRFADFTVCELADDAVV